MTLFMILLDYKYRQTSRRFTHIWHAIPTADAFGPTRKILSIAIFSGNAGTLGG
jgi:hypothetical protein